MMYFMYPIVAFNAIYRLISETGCINFGIRSIGLVITNHVVKTRLAERLSRYW